MFAGGGLRNKGAHLATLISAATAAAVDGRSLDKGVPLAPILMDQSEVLITA